VNPFLSLPEYEEFIYTLPQHYPAIAVSTLVVVRRGASQATVAGILTFAAGYQLVVRERLTAEDGLVRLERYSYEGWRNLEILYWYDSQAHPNNPALALNHPHHKHVPPDIKHNRIPAPGLSFTQANLPFLIHEIEQILLLHSPVTG
jgi:hypothetical protein